ncbi:methyl-accepting chemotaxis protein [Bdellovibrio sp. HCB209]|uniref:methyl-accepting chemotaxis protein n=1 Tax=Bdellovibrio sp. HCB209 TaxID=3394354 RepID=UPI0039B4964A
MDKKIALQAQAIMSAIFNSQAMIEFQLDGTIINANENFLFALGYQRDEIVGRHHRIFCDQEYVLTEDYRKFWKDLGEGQSKSGEYCRYSKSGHIVWIQASYNPIRDEQGVVQSVVKVASVITKQKNLSLEQSSIVSALGKSQATIEFDINGHILTANDNFLNAMGYPMSEIVGKHHSIFCDETYAASSEYADFWSRLRSGEFQSGEYRRFGKGHREVWIQASYNPVVDTFGKVTKVIKFASDVTARKIQELNFEGMVKAISNSQASIEFDLEGNILSANKNFLVAMGYSEDEIVGKHHRMFCDHAYASSNEYQEFWNSFKKGTFHQGTFCRYTKSGAAIWLKATYSAIYDFNGKPFKIVKYATNFTEEKNLFAEMDGKLQAIKRSQAVIEFDLDGNVLDANDAFLHLMKYDKEQVVGKHHRIFCKREYTETAEYILFWERLKKGEFIRNSFERVASDGGQVWIQATYNPIIDASGKTYKIMKLATDITLEKKTATIIQAAGINITDHVNELSRAANQIASASFEAEIIVNQSRDNAEVGKEKVQQVIKSAEEFELKANTISGIVSKIQDLSDRTNLLAFNATIEAVRAGELGRGFSVVADEVRKLADQSAEAALKIESLVSEALQLAKNNQSYSKEVVEAFFELSQGISKTANGVATIGDSTKQQNNLATAIKSEIEKIAEVEEESSTIVKAA